MNDPFGPAAALKGGYPSTSTSPSPKDQTVRTSVQRWLLVLLSGVAGVVSVMTSGGWALATAPTAAAADPEPTDTATEPAPTSTKSATPTTKATTASAKPKATKTKSTKTQAAPSAVAGDMKDGTYTGGSFSAGSYGTVKVQITVAGGQITKVSTPKLPGNDRESQRINDQAGPWLRDQAIGVSSAAEVAGVGGASYTTSAFKKSLQDAINKAKK